MALQDYDNASKFLDYAYIKAKEHNFYKNDKVNLFANKSILLSYVNADVENYMYNFKIISNNFKLLDDNGEFSKILNENDYRSRERDILEYLKNHNIQYSRYIINLLSCLYMEDTYKKEASKVMRASLKDMNKAQEFIHKGDNASAEKIYLSIISKNKYMYQAYYNLGILYLQTDRREKAKEIFSKILDINPNDEEVRKICAYL
jgi:tetratricopeptide (TPR) repeat protein